MNWSGNIYAGGLILAYGICNLTQATQEVLIFTYAYNRPDFIKIQSQTFKKFLKDKYRFIVFNDAHTEAMEKQICDTCKSMGVECVRIPQSIHTKPYLKRLPRENYQAPAVRNCNVVMYSLHEMGFAHDGIVVLLDSDMFLIRDFSIVNYMQEHDLAGLKQNRPGVQYLWIGLAFLDMRKMPHHRSIDFNCGRVGNEPVDAGGYTHYYLQNNPRIRLRFFEEGFIHNFNFGLDKTTTVPLEGTNIFFHYYAGTNWTNWSAQYHEAKTELLNNFIYDRLHN